MVMNSDGTTLYVISSASQGVAALTRDPATGNLSQVAAQQACVTRTGSGAQCNTSPSIDAPTSLALSPDGADLYVAGDGAANGGGFVTALDVISGGLAQHVGGGCFENTVTAGPGCGDARQMAGVRRVQVSPDNTHVYVTAATSNAVVVFSRDLTGGLTAVGVPEGCIQTTGMEGCQTSALLSNEVFGLAFTSPQRAYVSLVSGGAIVMLQRDPATGGLTAPGPCASADTVGPRAGCSDLPYNFFGVVDLEPTPDGALIAGGRFGRGFAAFSLAPDGTPTASAPPLGCIATGGIGFTTPCTIPRGFARAFGQDFGPNDVALSGDGKFVYGVSPQEAEDRAGIVAARRDTADPVCADGSVDVVAGQSVSIPLSCSDVDGDTLTVAIISAPSLGTTGAVDQASQTVSYTAPTDFQGTQTLTFKGTEQGIDSALATVTINVVAPAQADTTPPELSLSGKKRQLLDGAVEVTASCNEACSSTGAGTLTVITKGGKSGGKATLAKRKFELRASNGGGRGRRQDDACAEAPAQSP